MQSRRWKDFLTEEQDDDTESLSSKEGKLIFYIALFFEILGIVTVAISALYLRFFPVTSSNFIPSAWISSSSDVNYNKNKGSQEYVWLFYMASLLIPFILITIEELEHCAFPKNSRSKHLTGSERFMEGIPKYGRFIGMFILGAFLTSLLVDYLKILVSRPRPYLLTEFEEIRKNLTAPFTSSIYSVQSFPSHVSAVVAYCCVFSACYCYINKLYGKTPSLLIIVTQCFLFLTVTCCIDRYNNNFSHIEDILVGLLIGIFFGVYVSYHVFLIQKNAPTLPSEVFKLPFLPRVNLPPTVEATNIHKVQDSLQPLNLQPDNVWRNNMY